MLTRGVRPHLHPQTQSSGLVWGRLSPPAPARSVVLPSWWLVCRGRRSVGEVPESARGRTRGRLPPYPWTTGRTDSNVPAPAGCWVQHVHYCLSRWDCPKKHSRNRSSGGGGGPLCPMAQGHGEQQAGPPGPSESFSGPRGAIESGKRTARTP